MPKTPKQSHRVPKKQKKFSVRNPFLLDLPFLPHSMTNKLKTLERIELNNLDDIVSSIEEIP
jgi:hypothetical protein